MAARTSSVAEAHRPKTGAVPENFCKPTAASLSKLARFKVRDNSERRPAELAPTAPTVINNWP